MRNALKTAALLAALTIGTSAALAQTASNICPAGYAASNGACLPLQATGSSLPRARDPGPPVFGPTSASYASAMKTPWPNSAGGDCPRGCVIARFGNKAGCYSVH